MLEYGIKHSKEDLTPAGKLVVPDEVVATDFLAVGLGIGDLGVGIGVVECALCRLGVFPLRVVSQDI